MRAMILAAGRGERMGALTAHTPKPLLRINEQYLIQYAIVSLARAGIQDIVINISYLGDQIKKALGDGSRYGVNLLYSEEEKRLETGGGIFNALPLLGSEPFLVVSADVITDFPFKTLPKQPEGLAHLVLVDNPDFHLQGDFGLVNGRIDRLATPAFTYANIGIYRPELFAACKSGHFPLNNILFPAIDQATVTGEYYQGIWYNVGTPANLEEINLRAREDSNLWPLVSETNTLSN